VIFRFSFFRFHSGGVGWNCEGSVKGDRREPRRRACPLTGSSQFRLRSCGSERRRWMRGMLFACFIAPHHASMWTYFESCGQGELQWCSGLLPRGFDGTTTAFGVGSGAAELMQR
jgi:hypothetical protein